MPRRLIVMRHAKSSWSSGATSDHARPLNGRGRRDAPRMGAELTALGWWPDAVVSSDAQRTRETWAGLRQEGEHDDTEVVFTRALYHAGLAEVHAEAAAWPESWETVLVLGHNPGWEAMVAQLTGAWREMTTANAALLTTEADSWIAALEGPWRCEAFLRPKELSD